MTLAAAAQTACPLCAASLSGGGGTVLWSDADWRVVRVQEPGFPGFYRVIAQQHVAEWSDLQQLQRDACMRLILAVETALRAVLAPAKINLAALGNMVPHLHWHVVARFEWDSHFPASVWSAAVRERNNAKEAAIQVLLPQVDAHIIEALSPSAR